jgi:hypothetical protein
MARNEGTPARSDRSARNAIDYPIEHTAEVEDNEYYIHVPPMTTGQVPQRQADGKLAGANLPVGDMTKVVYDPDNDGVVSNADHATDADSATSANDPDAIHKNIASEISTITEKTTPVAADKIIIEDSEDNNNKKMLQFENLPGWDGGGGGGGGDVVGPSSAVDGHLAVFDGTTGKLIKDGGAVPSGGGGGALVLLEQHTANNSATLDFTSISSTYDEYVLEILSLVPVTDNVSILLQVGTGSGPTYQTSNYRWARWAHNQAGATAAGGSASDSNIPLMGNLSNTSTEGLSGTIKVRDPGNASTRKHFNFQLDGIAYTGNYSNCVGSAVYASSTPVTAIRFLCSSGNISSGVIRLYGITKS